MANCVLCGGPQQYLKQYKEDLIHSPSECIAYLKQQLAASKERVAELEKVLASDGVYVAIGGHLPLGPVPLGMITKLSRQQKDALALSCQLREGQKKEEQG